MNNVRKVIIKNEGVAKAIQTNIFELLLGDNDYTTVKDEGCTIISYDMDNLSESGFKIIEYALIQYAKLGYLGETPEEIQASVEPGFNMGVTNDCMFYIAQNESSLKKFTDEVLRFSDVSLNNCVEIRVPVNNKALQLTKPAVIVTNLTPQQRGKIKSSSNFKKWGMTGGKIINNVTSGVGLMAHTIVDEAIAPSAVNLGVAGSKIMKSAVVSGARIVDVIVDEGAQAILEVANVVDSAQGFSKAKERVTEAWSLISKKKPNDDDFISF